MISVIVPVYNVENYLEACLESIINQSYSDLEIILIDDGSVDSSGAICDKYGERDSRVKPIHVSNGGVSYARNIGLSHSTGEYVIMVDSDDLLHPQMLDTLYKKIQREDYDFAMCFGEQVYNYIDIHPSKDVFDSAISLSQDFCMRNLFKGDKMTVQYQVLWNKLYKRELLFDLFLNKTESEDTEFNNRVYLRMNKAVLVPAVLYYWVQHPSSITHQGIDRRYAFLTNSYSICLDNIPKKEMKYRAYCLVRLYRMMLSTSYWTRKTSLHHEVLNNCALIKRKTMNDFLSNKEISFLTKYRLLFLNFFPSLYYFFIDLIELKARFKFLFKRM